LYILRCSSLPPRNLNFLGKLNNLKSEFSGVKRTYIPMHAVIRIDEVEKEGNAKIHDTEGSGGQVVGFPGSYIPPGKPPGDT